MHGAAITERRYVVAGDPPSITTGSGDEEKRAELDALALKPLISLLESERFATFLAETPKEGQPAPGMEHCTLDLHWKEREVKAKKWRSTDELTSQAAGAEKALRSELAKLAKP
jgi:hypothetical protein